MNTLTLLAIAFFALFSYVYCIDADQMLDKQELNSLLNQMDNKEMRDMLEKVMSGIKDGDLKGSPSQGDPSTSNIEMSPSVKTLAQKAIDTHNVMIFAKSYCPYCNNAAKLFDELKVKYERWDLDKRADGEALQDVLQEMTNQRTVPNIFINRKHVGGFDKTNALHEQGELLKLLEKTEL